MEEWVKLTTVWGDPQAQILKSFLEGEGIRVRLRYQVPPGVYPVTVDGLAEVQVWVPAEELGLAQDALAAFPLPEAGGAEGA